MQVFFKNYFVREKKKNQGKWYELGKSETFDAKMSKRNAAKQLNFQELLIKFGTYDFGLGSDFQPMEA